ncbi:MAG: hypothetical protein SGJ20_17085, partial [Planctomycetota bacterium]|nr:hypothetical protein [Planctomycetota bacterium]
TATYQGVGSGTLNDGIIGNSLGTSQLFVIPSATDGTLINPAIFATMAFAYTIDHIDIYGGDVPQNFIPGALTSLTVELLDINFVTHSETFNLTPFGTFLNSNGDPVNDTLSLIGSSLEGIAAYTVTLKDFQGTVENWFSITELEIYGDRYVAPDPGVVPEPASIIVWGGLAAIGSVIAYRRKRRCAA